MSPATKRRPCIGCGLRPVKGLRYCRVCRARLAAGQPVDLEAFTTFRDSRAAKAPDTDAYFTAFIQHARHRGLAAMRATR